VPAHNGLNLTSLPVPSPVPDDYLDPGERRFRRSLSIGLVLALVLGIIIVIILLWQCWQMGLLAGLTR
jgi:hypothetical protein